MDPRDRILSRLRDQPETLEALVALSLDHLLAAPVGELVDPHRLAEAIAKGIARTARAPNFEGWVAARIEAALAQARGTSRGTTTGTGGTLAERVPVTVLGPLETALSRPYQPDPELVRAVLDHESTRTLVREMLQANLVEFGQRMRSAMPDAGKLPGGGFASRLAGVAKGVASAVSSELERQFEPRVRSFVDDVLGKTIDGMIERIGSPEFAPSFADWRVNALHGLLRQPMERLVAEGHKIPAPELAADATALLRALAAWRGLAAAIEARIDELLGEPERASIGGFLADSGLEAAWREDLERGLVAIARDVVAGRAFADWLDELLADP